MLEHVSRGLKLTTDLVNGIIDKANGQMIPSNGVFVNTQNGPLFINDNRQLPSDMTFTTTTFLNCQIQTRLMLKERPFIYENGEFKRKIFVNLGNNISTSKSLIKYNCNAIEEILLITGDDDKFDYKVDDEILQPTTSLDNKLALMNTGFVDTNVVYENALTIFGTIYKFVEDKEKPENAKYYFIVTDKTTDLKDRIIALLGLNDDSEKSEMLKIFELQLAISTESGKNKSSVIIQTPYINFIDTLSSENCDCKPISVDTQISALNRKSIDTQTYEYELSTEVEKLDEDGKVVIGAGGKPEMEIKVEKLSVDYYELYQFGCTVNDECRKISEFFKKDENGCGCTNDKLTLVSRVEKEDEETGEIKAEIEYIQFDLSNGIEISGDSQVNSTTNDGLLSSYSVELLQNTGEEKFYTLYKFGLGCADSSFKYLSSDEEGNRTFEVNYYSEITNADKTIPLDSNITLLTRIRNENTCELRYIDAFSLSEFTKGLSGVNEISGDSQQEYTLSKSVALSSIDGKKCYTLYNFNGGCSDAELAPEGIPADGYNTFKVLYDTGSNMAIESPSLCLLLMRINKGDTGNCELKYLALPTLTSIIPYTDTEIFGGCEDDQKSIEIETGCMYKDGNVFQYKAYQLYGIDRPSDIEKGYTKTVIKRQGNDPESYYGDSNYTESLLPEGFEFVVRTVNSEGCGTIHYMPLSVGVELPETDTEVGTSKSVTVRDDKGEYLTLYNFTEDNTGYYSANYEDYIDDSGFFVDGCDGILFRKITNLDNEDQLPELHYITFQSLKDYVQPIGDADAASRNDADENDSYSILKKTTKQHIDYYQLYDFDNGSIEPEYIQLNSSSNVCLNVDDDAFLIRTFDENGVPVLKYKQIFVKQDNISSDINVNENFTEIYNQINILSAEITNLSGTCSCDLSGAWVRDGTYEENYGCSIGDSYQHEVINLDSRELIGCWKQSNGSMCFYNNYNDNYNSTIIDGGSVTVNNSIQVGTLDPTYVGEGRINSSLIYGVAFSGCVMTLTDRIIIGNTSITESQLQQLLALLN